MKVLFCTNDQSFQPSNEPYAFYLGIQSLGHSVEVFYYRKKSFFYSNFRKPWVRWMNNQLAEKCINEGFDMLFVHRGGYVVTETLERIRKESRCRTVCFFPDNPFGAYTPPLPFDLIGAYDLFVSKDTYFEEEFETYGFDNVVALPHAYDPSEFETEFSDDELEPFCADVAFIGGFHPFRERIFSKLTDEGVEFKIWGPRWVQATDPWIKERVHMERALDRVEKIKVLKASKILINLQHGGGALYWPDDKVVQYMGAGALMIVNDRRDLGLIFERGEEILTYQKKEELQALIRECLDDEPKRLDIAHAGQARARRDHTTAVRFEQILTLLNERGLPVDDD
jgi:glycosyltransferase involved in cell wall biosynthesis